VSRRLAVHDYLTADGAKISMSGGSAGLADPVALARDYGTDAVRWWLLREVPRVGDADFTTGRLIECADRDLANGLGNLVSRVTSLAHARPPGAPALAGPVPQDAAALARAVDEAPALVAAALAGYDFRAAIAAVWRIVDEANRYAEGTEPWRLARAARAGDGAAAARLDEVLGTLLRACRALGRELAPFVPGLAARIGAACGGTDGKVPAPQALFRRLGRTAKETPAAPAESPRERPGGPRQVPAGTAVRPLT
jgi:methionyl-tRNA synthetase